MGSGCFIGTPNNRSVDEADAEVGVEVVLDVAGLLLTGPKKLMSMVSTRPPEAFDDGVNVVVVAVGDCRVDLFVAVVDDDDAVVVVADLFGLMTPVIMDAVTCCGFGVTYVTLIGVVLFLSGVYTGNRSVVDGMIILENCCSFISAVYIVSGVATLNAGTCTLTFAIVSGANNDCCAANACDCSGV